MSGKQSLRGRPFPATLVVPWSRACGCVSRGEGEGERVRGLLTIMKHSLHIKTVCGASLVVGAPLQVGGQLTRAAVVDHTRVVLTDAICKDAKHQTLNHRKVKTWQQVETIP